MIDCHVWGEIFHDLPPIESMLDMELLYEPFGEELIEKSTSASDPRCVDLPTEDLFSGDAAAVML